MRLASASAVRAASACFAQASAALSSAFFCSRASCVAFAKSVSSWRLMNSASDLRGRASLVGELLHALVDGEVQERDQDLAALLGLALQEGVELALREDDGAREAVVVEAEDAVHLCPDLLDAVSDGFGGIPGDALEALLGGLVGAGRAGDAVALLPDPELEHDREALGAMADELLVVVADAGDLAVEGEADRVDQGRLASAGRAGYGEEIEAGEVQLDLVAEGGEALQGKANGSHEAACQGIDWAQPCAAWGERVRFFLRWKIVSSSTRKSATGSP